MFTIWTWVRRVRTMPHDENSVWVHSLPAATKSGQGNVFTGVCDSVNRGVSASVHAGMPPPRTRPDPPNQAHHPPTRHTPPQTRHTHPGPGTHTPQTRHTTPQTRPPPRGEPPPPKQTPAYGQRAAGTHPTGMQSCFLLMYTYQWVLILFTELG